MRMHRTSPVGAVNHAGQDRQVVPSYRDSAGRVGRSEDGGERPSEIEAGAGIDAHRPHKSDPAIAAHLLLNISFDPFTQQTCHAHPGGTLDECIDIQDRFGAAPLHIGDPVGLCVPELFALVGVDAFTCHAATGSAPEVGGTCSVCTAGGAVCGCQ
jgi:hypothetical protein